MQRAARADDRRRRRAGRDLAGGQGAAAAARDDPRPASCAGGARIAELAIVEQLGVSRTPVRTALMRLRAGRPARSAAQRRLCGADVLRARRRRCDRAARHARRPVGAARGRARRAAGGAARGARLPAAHRRAAARSRRSTTRPSRATSSINARFHALLSEMAGSDADRAAAGARQRPAVRLAHRLRGGAGQLAGRARHAGDRAGPAPAGARCDRAARRLARRGADARARRIAQRNLREALHEPPALQRLPGVQPDPPRAR